MLDCLPRWHVLSTWEEKQEEVGMQQKKKKARRSSHCGLCFPLVCLPGPDLSAAAAPQMKVGRRRKMMKVQVELHAAQSGDLWSKPRGRRGIQLALMTATEHDLLERGKDRLDY